MGPTLLLWREGESQDKDNGWKGPQQESQHQLRASSCLPTPIWALTPDPTPIASGKKSPSSASESSVISRYDQGREVMTPLPGTAQGSGLI